MFVMMDVDTNSPSLKSVKVQKVQTETGVDVKWTVSK